MKYLHIYNIGIYRKFYQNRLIGECARKSSSHRITKSQKFVRCRRTLAFNRLRISGQEISISLREKLANKTT